MYTKFTQHVNVSSAGNICIQNQPNIDSFHACYISVKVGF